MLTLLLTLFFWLVVIGVVLSIVWFILSKIPALAPFMWIVQVVGGLLVLLVVLEVLLGGGGACGGLHFGALR
jgi:hypothetical protein